MFTWNIYENARLIQKTAHLTEVLEGITLVKKLQVPFAPFIGLIIGLPYYNERTIKKVYWDLVGQEFHIEFSKFKEEDDFDSSSTFRNYLLYMKERGFKLDIFPSFYESKEEAEKESERKRSSEERDEVVVELNGRWCGVESHEIQFIELFGGAISITPLAERLPATQIDEF